MKQKQATPREKAYKDPKPFLRFLSYSDEKEVLARKLLETLNPKGSWKVLDVGGGSGNPIKRLIPKSAEVTFIEPSRTMINLARKNLVGRKVKYFHGKFEDFSTTRRFDLVLASHVMRNFPDWEDSLEKLAELKKKTGHLIIVEHSDNSEYLQMVRQFWPLLHNEAFDERAVNEIIEILQKLSYKPAIDFVTSHVSIPSITEALRLSNFLFYKKFEMLNQAQKEALKERFKGKLIDGKVVIEDRHSIIHVN